VQICHKPLVLPLPCLVSTIHVTHRARQLLFQVQIAPSFTRSVCHFDCAYFLLNLVQPSDDARRGAAASLFILPPRCHGRNHADHADDSLFHSIYFWDSSCASSHSSSLLLFFSTFQPFSSPSFLTCFCAFSRRFEHRTQTWFGVSHVAGSPHPCHATRVSDFRPLKLTQKSRLYYIFSSIFNRARPINLACSAFSLSVAPTSISNSGTLLLIVDPIHATRTSLGQSTCVPLI
jgi:hypothetical protein